MFEYHYDRWWGMVNGVAITAGCGNAAMLLARTIKVRAVIAAVIILLIIYACTQPERYWSNANYWPNPIRQDRR